MNLNAMLISWSPSTGTLTYSVDGVMQTSTVISTSTPHRAALNLYPNDPIRTIVTNWNALIEAAKGQVTFDLTTSDVLESFTTFTAELATHHANMQIHLEPNSNFVASLRPIPFLPPNPI